MTPYPGTALYDRIDLSGRLLHRDWDRYDTRQCVYRPAKMTPEQLEEGYWWAYDEFYRWSNILTSASTKPTTARKARHIAYSAGWKKLEPLWSTLVAARRIPLRPERGYQQALYPRGVRPAVSKYLSISDLY